MIHGSERTEHNTGTYPSPVDAECIRVCCRPTRDASPRHMHGVHGGHWHTLYALSGFRLVVLLQSESG